ncbi:uncharacterized protein LOC125757812 [Rhipicephalus sanguineus]|uniref:uncharacterized protein LOC125757812 n=1 Tax=Rhipicephalus sanguineus TaxID=34632 RepID=UPI0020C21C83|nr:uncharacterized protein LOC125757812 [Rhipicephalus sanguineus]
MASVMPAEACAAANSPFRSPKKLYTKCDKKWLSKQTKQVICNVYAGVRRRQPDLSTNAVCQTVAELTGVSERTVKRVKAEALRAPLASPKRKKLTFSGQAEKRITGKTRLLRYDTFALAALRRKVHSYFMRNEIPTAEKLRNDVISDPDMDMPTISTRTIQRMLNDLGFAFRKRTRNSALLERDDIVAWRRKYLRTIREMRRQRRTIYYLDETWVNAGHTKGRVWTDTSVMTRQDAFRQGLSTGLRAPSGKGGRLIVLHAGSAEGFVDGAALVFRAKKGAGDYHTEMDASRFQKWFVEQLLPNIKPHSVIVMDNAPYHSAQVEKLPSSSSRKAEIQSWLISKNIPFSDDQLKSELLQLVEQNKHLFLAYQVDKLASAAGHEVVRLPPYHCELNPIELVWSQVKGYVASRNTDFKIESVEKLLQEGIASVTQQNWLHDCTHVMRLEDEAWERDGIIDSQTDSLIILYLDL